jgi:DMSO reductase anchor subunit
MTGAILLVLVASSFGVFRPAFGWLALALIAAGFAAKLAYWRLIDTAKPRSTLGTATGLDRLGEVRLLEMPHTEENFLMREMGFKIARKHARKLRMIATVTLFLVPFVLMALVALVSAPVAMPLALLATLSAAIGVGVERWLFFAEATHVSMLYYGYPS